MSEETTEVPAAPEQQPIRHGEYKVAAILLVISIALFIDSLRSEGIFQGRSAGPGSIPQLASGVLVLMLLGVVVQHVRSGYKEGTFADFARHVLDKDVVILLLTLTIYGFIVETIHFLPATFLFLVATMYLLERKKLVQKVLVSTGTLAGLYLIFTTVFRVVLP
jgi:putative tricarboxylic transport membrane protein